MLFRPFGMAGYILIVAAMLMKSFGVLSSLYLVGALAFAGLVCFGIEENRFGKRHWMVKYIDYAPLVMFGFIYAVQMRDQMPSFWYALVIIPLSALSGWEANRLARKEKYRTMRRIEEMLPKQPKEHHHKHR